MHKLFAVLAVLLAGCATSGHKKFYHPYAGSESLQDVERLNPGQSPRIFSTDDLGRDVRIAKSKGFVPIGYSSFNGGLEGESQLTEQAKRVGAVLVLVSSQYTNTQTNTVPLFIPQTSTTSTYGTVSSGGAYGSYSGQSTTQGTAIVPMTSSQRRFDQSSVYFVKNTKQPRFGVWLVDLTPEMRTALQRNLGGFIDVVMEDSPAFDANILPNDILIEFDGEEVRNAEHFFFLLERSPSIAEKVPFEVVVLRNGDVKRIRVNP